MEVSPVRAVSAVDSRSTSVSPTATASTADSAATTSAAPIVSTSATSAGAMPIDEDRVALIRRAIATDSYPIYPTKIGDAMIAAGLLLRGAQ